MSTAYDWPQDMAQASHPGMGENWIETTYHSVADSVEDYARREPLKFAAWVFGMPGSSGSGSYWAGRSSPGDRAGPGAGHVPGGCMGSGGRVTGWVRPSPASFRIPRTAPVGAWPFLIGRATVR
jgi:hypothetical protein